MGMVTRAVVERGVQVGSNIQCSRLGFRRSWDGYENFSRVHLGLRLGF